MQKHEKSKVKDQGEQEQMDRQTNGTTDATKSSFYGVDKSSTPSTMATLALQYVSLDMSMYTQEAWSGPRHTSNHSLVLDIHRQRTVFF